MIASLTMDSPFGTLSLDSNGAAITALRWADTLPNPLPPDQPDSILKATRDCLRAYFAGATVSFNIPIHFTTGTPFQKKIWQLLTQIPYGATRSYGDLAREQESAARAVGSACGANPIPILVPCHRILAADGRLGGYSGHHGTETKRRLLILEGVLLPL